MTRTAAGIIVPDDQRFETDEVRRGRDVNVRILTAIADARAQGKKLSSIRISKGSADAMRAHLYWCAASFDGILPTRIRGVQIVTEPGDTKALALDYAEQ